MTSPRANKGGVLDQPESRAAAAVYCSVLLLLLFVPLVFSTAIHRFYALPKFLLLLTGSAVTMTLLAPAWAARARRGDQPAALFTPSHSVWLGLYLSAIAVSTFFGVAPFASLFGSFDNQMGLLTHACFLVCFVGLVIGVNRDLGRWRTLLACMSLSGALAAAYAWAQFFGFDPFVSPRLYTYGFAGEIITRVASTLGHANYLGNFLLYTAPISAAFAFAAAGRFRALALISTALPVGAVVMSGTRGAWIGLAAGAVAFAILESRGILTGLRPGSRRSLVYAALSLAAVIASTLIIASGPSARSIAARARMSTSEAMSGAGRTILWRDSLKMVPAYAVIGCGPEGFRKAFLAYRSEELSRLAPRINNESSHSSYLDAAISYGLAGATGYLAVITSTFVLIFRARRRAGDAGTRVLLSGLAAAFVSALAHKFFIFDQIPTGLYFFSVVALAQASINVTRDQRTDEKRSIPRGAMKRGVFGWAGFVAGCAVLAAALWYSYAVWQADVAIKKVFSSAAAADVRSVMYYRERATGGPDPPGDYDFQFARALTTCIERMEDQSEESPARREAVESAIAHARKSVAHSLTPNSGYLLLASISLLEGDREGLRAYSAEALRLDPNYFVSHWLMAESHLSDGDRERAIREARAALGLNPASLEAKLTLDRAEGRAGRREAVEALLEEGRALAREGRIRKARQTFIRALRNSNGPCPDCQKALEELDAGVIKE
ncbi:MAG TPA: O-antigen ligase family protein [Blastocatellia bacterium]|nr:O-antigen ligase family protein [Blastocatellia bacterium]